MVFQYCDRCNSQAVWVFYLLRPPAINRELKKIELKDRLELTLCHHHSHSELGTQLISEGWVACPLQTRYASSILEEANV